MTRPAGTSSGFLKVQPADAAIGCDILRFSREASQRSLIFTAVSDFPLNTA